MHGPNSLFTTKNPTVVLRLQNTTVCYQGIMVAFATGAIILSLLPKMQPLAATVASLSTMAAAFRWLRWCIHIAPLLEPYYADNKINWLSLFREILWWNVTKKKQTISGTVVPYSSFTSTLFLIVIYYATQITQPRYVTVKLWCTESCDRINKWRASCSSKFKISVYSPVAAIVFCASGWS